MKITKSISYKYPTILIKSTKTLFILFKKPLNNFIFPGQITIDIGHLYDIIV